MEDPEELMGATKAATYLGITVTRLNEIRRSRPEGQELGKEIAGRWVYSKAELDALKAAPKNRGGRPKSLDLIASPGIRVAA